MTVTDPRHPAHLAGKRSRDAVAARDKQTWLDNFADDAIVQDPIGPSFFDPDGNGHQGKEAIAAFWDKAIARQTTSSSTSSTRSSAATRKPTSAASSLTMGGHRITTPGVFTYRRTTQGRLVALRAFWEVDRATAEKIES